MQTGKKIGPVKSLKKIWSFFYVKIDCCCVLYVRIAQGVQENVSILEINIMSTSATTRTNWIYNDPKQHSAELDFLGGSRDI